MNGFARILTLGLMGLAAQTFFLPAAFGTTVTEIADAQRMLNRLGHEAGAVDGLWGGATRRALAEFYENRESEFDGTLDEDDLSALKAAIEDAGISMIPRKGLDIENAPERVSIPPRITNLILREFQFKPFVHEVDFTNDGITDLLFAGPMRPENRNPIGVDMSGYCGGETCYGEMAWPVLFIGRPGGRFELSLDRFIDNWDNPGLALPSQIVAADYNEDGTLDLYFPDDMPGAKTGMRDSYYLSQGDGTWLESSTTHMTPSGRATRAHGATTGDIDNDGDMDVVTTTLKSTGADCWENRGAGKMRLRRGCAPGRSFSMELGDLDGDNDLDLVVGGDDSRRDLSDLFIAWNDGRGRFDTIMRLHPVREVFPRAPEVSMADLDGDGDLDITVSRIGYLYAGTAVQVIENLGERNFQAALYALMTPPDGYEPDHEANAWNTFVTNFLFRDLDDDGDLDIVLKNAKRYVDPEVPDIVFGSYLRNDGDMQFTHVKRDDPESALEILQQEDFYVDADKFITETEATREFLAHVEGAKWRPLREPRGFTPLDIPIALERFGGIIRGYKDFGFISYTGKLAATLHVDLGEVELPIPVEIMYHPRFNHTSFSAVFREDWGFVVMSDIVRGRRVISNTGLDEFPVLAEIGVDAFLKDLHDIGPALLGRLTENDPEMRAEIAAQFENLDIGD